MRACEYCGQQFSPQGMTAHRRRCKRAKPAERDYRNRTGDWKDKPKPNISVNTLSNRPRWRSLAIGNKKVHESN